MSLAAISTALSPHPKIPFLADKAQRLQSVADYVLAPYLVGQRVHLKPVWIMFALFACGYLFGFVGLLIAVPLASAIGVLVRFALRRYYASSLYSSSATRSPPQSLCPAACPNKIRDANLI